MQLSCIHCGFQFSITAQQLGGRGRCPRCAGEIELPNLEGDEQEAARPFGWVENSISALGSFVFHMALFLILALIVQEPGGTGMAGEGEEVSIGPPLPSPTLSDNAATDLTATKDVTPADQALAMELEVVSPTEASDSLISVEINSAALPSTSGGSFDLGASVSAAGGGGGGGFGDMVQQLKRNGLDIVIVFDSTGSMGGEITQVKSQIKRIGNALVTLIPKTRISVCTYRDRTDAYTVKGTELTGDVQSLANYLADISAGGGGDMPEAVQEGMKWSVANNTFKPTARKVMLIFGDAPPHAEDMKTCLEIASDFSAQQGGVVSTVTCRGANGAALPEFIEIAQAGGGEAFLTSDEKQIMTQLLVLVFGSKHRGKVLEAFKLLED